VQVINKRHLACVAAQAPATPRHDLHLDEYYHLLYRLIWGNPEGYVCVPQKPDNWYNWRLRDIKAFVSGLPVDSTLAIGVLDRGLVEIGLILELHEGVIDCVSTFEALDLSRDMLQVGSKLMEIVWQQLEQKFAPLATVLLCTPAIFEAWRKADNKRLVLQQAITANTAVLAIRKDMGPYRLSGNDFPRKPEETRNKYSKTFWLRTY
jgi:hypothetical protein